MRFTISIKEKKGRFTVRVLDSSGRQIMDAQRLPVHTRRMGPIDTVLVRSWGWRDDAREAAVEIVQALVNAGHVAEVK